SMRGWSSSAGCQIHKRKHHLIAPMNNPPPPSRWCSRVSNLKFYFSHHVKEKQNGNCRKETSSEETCC
ncbi:MAG: hypothetical protein NWQ13_06770, partial [Glaciimonas sp.]|nr:hypothetical protein [Glaciimonas sp.]